MPQQPGILKIGIIGAGRIGRVHARNLALEIKGAETVRIADIDFSAAQEVARLNNIEQADADYRDVLGDPGVDAVLICSSTDTHARFVIEAARANKHIFCEKPVDLTVPEVEAALSAVKQAGVIFQVGFNRRFDINFQKIKKGIMEGEIGRLHMLRIASRDPAPPPIDYIKRSGGIFLDMTIHDFDMARFLVGAEARRVFASGAVLVDENIGKAGDVDTAMVQIEFGNGVLCTIDNSRRAVYGYDQRVEAFGAKGMLRAENPVTDTVTAFSASSVISARANDFFLERYHQAYIAEIQAFVNCVIAGKTPAVGGHDGLMALKIGLAAKASLETKQPVELNNPDAGNGA